MRRYLIPAMALVGIGLIVLVWTQLGDGEPARDGAVEELIPGPGDEVLSQTAVGIDLVDGERYVVSLTLNGEQIPDEQLLVAESLNRVTFDPGEGQVVENLRAEQNCVLAEFYRLVDGPQSVESEFWCFQAF